MSCSWWVLNKGKKRIAYRGIPGSSPYPLDLRCIPDPKISLDCRIRDISRIQRIWWGSKGYGGDRGYRDTRSAFSPLVFSSVSFGPIFSFNENLVGSSVCFTRNLFLVNALQSIFILSFFGVMLSYLMFFRLNSTSFKPPPFPRIKGRGLI